jgi:molybdopterin-containing oxidoreductase family membrane subunit
LGFSCIIYTVSTGIGTWGLNKTVGWAWDITICLVGWYWSRWNFDFCFITFIRQRWRMAINRSAEAMTIFSVIQAGLFPIIHMGRPWLAVLLYRINLVLLGELFTITLGCICNLNVLICFIGFLVDWFVA